MFRYISSTFDEVDRITSNIFLANYSNSNPFKNKINLVSFSGNKYGIAYPGTDGFVYVGFIY